MDKRRLYRDIAKRAGIKDPAIEYHRERKAYSIGIELKTPSGGYAAYGVGLYYSPQEAEARVADDLKVFLKKHPEASEKVTLSYNTVTTVDAITPKQASRVLLENLLAQQETLSPHEVQELAQRTLEYIEKLEAPRVKERASGKYRSRVPGLKKKPIVWEQPGARQAPVYEFEVDCPYCGRHVSMERFSPHEPRHCGQEGCYQEHERELGKERQRRWRERHKGSKQE